MASYARYGVTCRCFVINLVRLCGICGAACAVWCGKNSHGCPLTAPFCGPLQAQVEHMTAKWHVYMTLDGRISMAGLNKASCGYLAEAITDAIRACP